MTPEAPADPVRLAEHLPRVSRTFALGIRLLPPELSHSVGVAYLICRIADTIEDDARLPAARREALLLQFREWLDGRPHDPAALVSAFRAGEGADAALVRATAGVLTAFARLPAGVQGAIRAPVEEMCVGMASYLARSDHADGAPPPRDLEDLEQYCWYVAGTVGAMLTDLFRLADGAWAAERHGRLRQLSRGFGLGLQLTNIIRDIGEDRNRGVSFVPASLLAEAGIGGQDLFAPGHEVATRQVLQALLARARQHLEDALEYCVQLPRRGYRVRLFCLVPMFLAAGTLSRIGAEGQYAGGWVRVKLSRGAVRAMVALSALVAPSNRLVRLVFRRLAPAAV